MILQNNACVQNAVNRSYLAFCGAFFYQTDQQQQEMGGLEIQLKTALPPSIFGVMLMMIMPGTGFWTFQEALTDW